MKEVWVVARLLPQQSKDAWELDGVYDTKEAALAMCRDENTAAVRFELNKDYRDIHEFESARPKEKTDARYE
jgi:hypothetical protein